MKTMKLVFLLSVILLTASTCKKEGDDCHYNINVTNSSPNNVYYAIPGFSADGTCRLNGSILNSNQTWEYRPFNSCVEDNLNTDDKIVIYIVDSHGFNSPEEYYSCDSILVKNDILATYDLNLSELKNINFTIDYH